MMESVAAWIKAWLEELTFPVQEVTVFFILTEPEEWVAYVEEMPAVNSAGSSAAGALAGLQRELKQYDTDSRTLTRITHYKYLRTHLPFFPS
jgi:hypothetical protein